MRSTRPSLETGSAVMRKNPLVDAQNASIIHLTGQLGACQSRYDALLEKYDQQNRTWLDRIRELEDSVHATSLEQLRGMHPTAAMEARVPDAPRKMFRHDPTGMIVEEVDPRDFAEGPDGFEHRA